MRLIDGNALYEKACDLEAQALDYTVKISNDEEKAEEWRRWSAILAERSAFKHDVYDAPTIEPERKTGRWIGNPETCEFMTCSACGCEFDWVSEGGYPSNEWAYCPECGAFMGGELESER